MAAIRQTDTKPEKLVRSLAHRLGYRFRLHRKDLPGTPDLVFVSRRKVIFVNGCFWHRHEGCSKAYTPSSRQEFWSEKFETTVARDAKKARELRMQGWTVLTVWECELQSSPEAVLNGINASIAEAV